MSKTQPGMPLREKQWPRGGQAATRVTFSSQQSLERSRDRREIGAERRAQPVHNSNNRERNARRDQTVFDRGSPVFVAEKLQQKTLQFDLPSHLHRSSAGTVNLRINI